jgi:hypothetical protein
VNSPRFDRFSMAQRAMNLSSTNDGLLLATLAQPADLNLSAFRPALTKRLSAYAIDR